MTVRSSGPAVRVSWATPVAAVAGSTLAAIGFAVAAVASRADPAGALLLGVAAAVAAANAVLGWVRRPRLSVVDDGPSGTAAQLRIRDLRGSHGYARDDLERVRVLRYPRLGRRIPMLEIEVREPERLVVLSWWDLGTHPDDVLDALTVHGLVPTAH